MAINKGMMSSKTNEWETPQYVFDYLNEAYGFTLDPCCTEETAKCNKYFTQEDNGLRQSWQGEIVFMNPPYGREIKHWVKKAHEESNKGALVVGLIPARTDTIYWHEHIFGEASHIYFIKGRLKFGEAENSAPFPSAIVVWAGEVNGTEIHSLTIKED